MEILFTVRAREVCPFKSNVNEGDADDIGEKRTITAAFLISYENGNVLKIINPKIAAKPYLIKITFNTFLVTFLSKVGSSNRPIINIAIGPFALATKEVKVNISDGSFIPTRAIGIKII